MSVNKAILIGHVGQDPIVRTFSNGSLGAVFSLATSESYTSKTGEKVTNTEWHNIAAFNNLAQIVEKYIRKGSKLYVEGKLQTRKWTDQNNVERTMTEIVASTIQMLDSKKSESGEQARQQVENYASGGESSQSASQDNPDNDLPF